MSHRTFTGTLWTVLKAIVFLAVAAGVTFFLLTRTERGRSFLVDRLVDRFNSQFAGTLSIERVEGTLAGGLRAEELALRDPRGHLVLRTASAEFRPRWWDLLRRQVTIQSLHLVEPDIFLVRPRPDAPLSLTSALQPPVPGEPDSTAAGTTPWEFFTADLTVTDGAIHTAAPRSLTRGASGNRFDPANTSLDSVDVAATVEWAAAGRLIDVQRASAYSPELDLPIRHLQGQLVIRPEQWILNQLEVSTPESRLTLGMQLENLRAAGPSGLPDLIPQLHERTRLALQVGPTRIDGREASLFVPNWELRDTVRVEGRLSGRPDSLHVESFALARGATRLLGSGTVRGRIDSMSARFRAEGRPFRMADVRALVPNAGSAAWADLDPIDLTLEGEVLRRPAPDAAPPSETASPSAGAPPSEWRLRTDLQARGSAGRLNGQLTVSGRPSRPLEYETRLRFEELDPGSAFDRSEWGGALTGRLELSGSGTSAEELMSEASVFLAPSRLRGRSIDSLRLDAQRTPKRLRVRTRLFQGTGGFLGAEATYLSSGASPRYRLDLDAESLDLAPLLPSDTLHTDLTARLAVRGLGSDVLGYRGSADVRIDSSAVRMPRGVLPITPGASRIFLRSRSSARPRLELTGDFADLSLSGDFTLDGLLEGMGVWGQAALRSWQKATDKPLPRLAGDEAAGSERVDADRPTARSDSAEADRATAAELQESFARLLTDRRGGAPIVGNGRLTLKRTLLFSTLAPGVPRLRGPLSVSTSWRVGADSLRAQADLSADSLTGPRLRVYGLESGFELSTAYGPTVIDRTDLTGRLHARRIDRGTQTLRGNQLFLTYDDGSARLQLRSDSIGTVGALRTALQLDVLPDRNRLTIQTIDLALRNTHWLSSEPQVVDLYRDAAVFHDIYLRQETPADRAAASPGGPNDTAGAEESRGDAASTGTASRDSIPHLALTGTLSSRTDDAAHLRIQHLRLDEFSRILALQRPWGGILTADVDLNAREQQLEATGTLAVESLTFDGHPLGHLDAQSRYVPGRDRIELDLALAHEAALPTGAQNEVSASGTVRLPQLSTRGAYLDPGSIDLDVAVGEADLFFFEDIFDQVGTVNGVVRGNGAITGTFRRPVFQGEFEIPSARFRLPRFNLTYQASGPVRIDRSGFHLTEARVTDGTGGEAFVSGDILFNDYEFWSFDLAADAQQFQIIDVTNSRSLSWYGDIWATGSATLTGPLDDALLRSDDLRSTPSSELYIPVRNVQPETDEAFIVFVDSTGGPTEQLATRSEPGFIPARNEDESVFLNNLDLNLNIQAPRGSTVHLVFDPLLGDAVEAVGSGPIQFGVSGGEVTTFGTFNVTGGSYLFTASEMFSRRFQLEPGSTITWDGDPIDAQLDINATYRTRASLAGLPGRDPSERIPMVIWLDMTGRVSSPVVDLRLAIDRDERTQVATISSLEPILNDEERAAEYATSVLLTNSFRLTLTGDTQGITESVDQLAFSTLSQLVANQLNRFVNHALSNVDINLGVQQGTTVQDLDLTYGVALYLLDERLVIRGQGIYDTAENQATSDNLQGKITVEVRLSQNVSVEVFYRREDEVLETISSTTPSYGAGVSYQTEFTSWRRFLARGVAGWNQFWNWFAELLLPSSSPSDEPVPSPADSTDVPATAGAPLPSDSLRIAPLRNAGTAPPDQTSQ